jgi:hypothetical protein
MDDNFLTDNDLWLLPRKKGKDGKKRQLKKNGKKYLKEHEALVKRLKSNKITVLVDADTTEWRGVYGSAE